MPHVYIPSWTNAADFVPHHGPSGTTYGIIVCHPFEVCSIYPLHLWPSLVFRYYSSTASCLCILIGEYVDPTRPHGVGCGMAVATRNGIILGSVGLAQDHPLRPTNIDLYECALAATRIHETERHDARG